VDVSLVNRQENDAGFLSEESWRFLSTKLLAEVEVNALKLNTQINYPNRIPRRSVR